MSRSTTPPRIPDALTMVHTMIKHLLATLITLAVAAASTAALAHGEATPRHGGVTRSVNDLSFELVALDSGAAIYIEDHGKPVSTSGFAGKLTVLAGSNRSDAALKPGSDNTLVADGIKLQPGAIAVAVLTDRNGRTTTVRFTLK
ncbi:hypothetical protein [Methyloversatilis discipulorum]|uniref:hypothetical protein n=1 Tax=Methyloversatilis discipulorum TaxID=1119528 RepID=UPI0018DED40A|nr:hypothetical protein [Methyloversatilis discipulorum]